MSDDKVLTVFPEVPRFSLINSELVPDGQGLYVRYEDAEVAGRNLTATRRIDAEEEFILRRLLAVRYSGAVLYTDDGELQDNYEQPSIDFLRDKPGEIERKIYQRHLNHLARTGVGNPAIS